jgi:AGCS family alanine or glycine:cation symporter
MLEFSESFVGLVWGPWLVWMLFGAGALFTIYFGFPQIKYFWHAIKIVKGDYDDPNDKGEISHFQALCAALSATIGLGNIAGVAFAIAMAGPGAVFWMWIAGFLGMATKFTSVSLSLLNRDESGSEVRGGPMYTIKNGLAAKHKGKNILLFGFFSFLAFIYALFVTLSSFGAGNMFQSNQMSTIIETTFGVSTVVSGIVFSVLAGLVLLGGIKRIGNVAGKLVPIMVTVYFLGAAWIVLANIEEIPGLLSAIFDGAFNGTAALGGFAGATFKQVLNGGVQRAVFSNEAGMGSAAIAHTAAKSSPIQEGLVALLGPFIDTVVVCTLTALVILITGAWSNGDAGSGSDMTAFAFEEVFGGAGRFMVTLTVVLFAFSTIISWSYYGEQGVVYMLGEKFITPYRVIFVFITFLGTQLKPESVLNIVDGLFGLLAYPNLLANVLLIGLLKREFDKYKKELKS